MVPPYSDRISRVPPYLSQAQYHTSSFRVRDYHPLWSAFPDRSAKSCAITCRLLRFRSPLLSESRLMSFPRATEMFQFTRFASHTYVFSMRYLCRWVSPFGNLRIKACLPAPRSLSQAITSFVAYHRQGIHHVHLFTCPYNFDLSFENQSYFQGMFDRSFT